MSMIHWLLDIDYYGGEQDDLREAIEAAGMDWKELPRRNFYLDRYDVFPKDEPTVFIGTLQVAQSIQRSAPYINVLLNPRLMKCSFYYNFFGTEMLNSNYRLLPWGELPRLGYAVEGEMNSLAFVRPDSGLKSFSGQILPEEEDFAKWYDFNNQSIEVDDLVLLAPEINMSDIEAEYRHFVINYEVVASSQYKEKGRSRHDENIGDEELLYAMELVESLKTKDVSGHFREGFTLDTCRMASGARRVVEINSISCSGMYAASRKNIVKSVAEFITLKQKELEETNA